MDTSDPQQQDAALTIQTKYRQYNAKKVVQGKKEEQAAVKIQSGFRGYQDRQKVKGMRSVTNAHYMYMYNKNNSHIYIQLSQSLFYRYINCTTPHHLKMYITLDCSFS